MSSNPNIVNIHLSNEAVEYYRYLRSQKVNVSRLVTTFLVRLSEGDKTFEPSQKKEDMKLPVGVYESFNEIFCNKSV